jgi:signal transduction histidine kinase
VSFASLRFRLLLGGAAFVLAALALAAIGLAFLFQRHVEQWIDAELTAHLDQLIAGIDVGRGAPVAIVRAPADPRFEQPLSGLYWEVAIEPAGPVLRSRSLWDYEIPLPLEKVIDNELHHHRVAGPGNSKLYLVQRRIELPVRLGSKTARVAVAVDSAEVDAAVRRFAIALVPFLALLSGLLTLAAWFQVSVGLRPLAAMRARLENIGIGKERRLGTGFPIEVQSLANEVDSLLDARDREVERARARAADLAHGLRTPLQVLQGDAETLKRKGEAETAEEIESVVTAMQGHVERELTRARMAAYDRSASADIRDTISRVIRVMGRTPEGRLLAWNVTVPNGLKARIDPDDLAEAVGNLVENAVRHATSRINIDAEVEGRSVTIAITDDGPGIPRERQQEALGRGVRLDESGRGSGFGLAIVNDIAETWGATLSFAEGEDDGLCTRLRLQLGRN